MPFTTQEILEIIRMTEVEHLDIRTLTMGINILPCRDKDGATTGKNIKRVINERAASLGDVVNNLAEELGVKVANKRLSLTPVSLVAPRAETGDLLEIAHAIDEAAGNLGIDYVGGYSCLVHAGFTRNDEALLNSIPDVLSKTERLCSSVNAASTHSGINMDAVVRVSHAIMETAEKTADRDSIGCSKFVVFANAVEDNPFIAGAFHGIGEPEVVLHVGISGPGVVLDAIKSAGECSFRDLSEAIKRAAFKITRVGELYGREAAKRLKIPFGIVDLSLAPTPEFGDSIAEVLKEMGLEYPGACGTTAALALLTDAVKKGGAMAASFVGGLSGAFIPVAEDSGMVDAVLKGHLSLEKLEAMTSVCSVGIDMVAVPGDTPVEVIAGLIADELAIGVINSKTTAVRVIPVQGKRVGESVSFGGLLGEAPIMEIRKLSNSSFIKRGGVIPPPITSFRN